MTINRKKCGFSLTEMLLATGIMAIGLVMIATIFPVGVKLTGMSVQRSIAPIVADEAFAKVQFYGLRNVVYWPTTEPNSTCTDYRYVTGFTGPDGIYWTNDDNEKSPGLDGAWGTGDEVYWDSEFLYPSAMMTDEDQKHHWSALCRRVSGNDVQVTVFVTHKTFASIRYHELAFDGSTYTPNVTGHWPTPVRVRVSFNTTVGNERILYLADDMNYTAAETEAFFSEGCTIVADYSGRIYRVLEKRNVDGIGAVELVLYDNWWPDPDSPNDGFVWVVPPGIGSSSNPCVGVFQQILHF